MERSKDGVKEDVQFDLSIPSAARISVLLTLWLLLEAARIQTLTAQRTLVREDTSKLDG
jgi:hypothetical protein